MLTNGAAACSTETDIAQQAGSGSVDDASMARSERTLRAAPHERSVLWHGKLRGATERQRSALRERLSAPEVTRRFALRTATAGGVKTVQVLLWMNAEFGCTAETMRSEVMGEVEWIPEHERRHGKCV